MSSEVRARRMVGGEHAHRVDGAFLRELKHELGWTDSAGAFTIFINAFWISLIEAVLERHPEDQLGVKTTQFRSEAPTFKDLAWGGDLLLDVRTEGWRGWLVEDDDGRCLALQHNDSSSQTEIMVYSPFGGDDAEACVDDLRARIPSVEPPTDDKIRMAFWALGTNGQASSWDRKVVAPTWEEIRENYPANVRDEMDQLHAWAAPPETGGRLLLLHGPAGTGKTSAIRSLGRAWKSWCGFHFVMDPEKFFGEAFYMLQLLLQEKTGRDSLRERVGMSLDVDVADTPDQWRLLVIEDADELLSADARRRSGQALSRLLNICDGLVGQGLRIMVLITTNEPVSTMHPAVVRPGRCLVDLHVRELEHDEANAWRSRHGVEARDHHGAVTLAQLYDELRHVQIKAGRTSARVGFKGRT